MGRFEDRNALVTGGSSGIGRAVVLAFAHEGAHVVAAARDAGRLASVQSEAPPGAVETVVLDVRDVHAVRRTLREVTSRLARLHVLVNCAGIAYGEPVLDISEQSWDDTLATNLTGAFFASQEAARHMVEVGGGVIVNVSSIDAFVSESPELQYCVSKAGMLMMTRCMAYELGHLGVRCNAVAPGLTRTPMLGGDLEIAEVYRENMRRIPLRRPADPEEQAAVVLFLASDEASYVNGETVVVDGGLIRGFWYDPRTEPPVTSLERCSQGAPSAESPLEPE